MLADDYQAELARQFDQIACRLQLPEQWAETYFSETGALPTTFDERRSFTRYRLRGKAILELESTIPTIPRRPQKHLVFTYDVARGGLAFLHTEQLYPSEIGRLWLPTQKVVVQVARCQYLTETCYLVGTELSRTMPASGGSKRESTAGFPGTPRIGTIVDGS